MLCHRYQPDPRFGAILVKLKRALPPSELGRLFVDANSEFEAERDVVRFPYVPLNAPIGTAGHWRSKYFAETPFGYWTSRECFAELDQRNAFHGKGEGRRRELLEHIAHAAKAQQNEWAKGFIKRLDVIAERVRREARRLRVEPHHLFQMDGRHVKAGYYRSRALQQIRQHATLAADKSFENRYVRGHTFVRVPAMRADAESFEELALGFCDSVLIAAARTQSRSRLATVLQDALEEDLSDMSSRKMLAMLRERWTEVGTRVVRFWREEG